MPVVGQGQRVTRDLEPEPEPEPEPGNVDDGLVCWVCQFADCEDHPEDPLQSTGCACCRPGSSGGRAHVRCLAGAAMHQPKLWHTCPTCKQQFTGTLDMDLSCVRWEIYRSHSEADAERLDALSDLACALVDSGDITAAQPLYKELVAVERRTRGNDHPITLINVGRLGSVLKGMGDNCGALLLLEEAVSGLQLAVGNDDEATLEAMTRLAAVHTELGAAAKARLLLEQVVVGLRRTEAAVAPNTFTTISNLSQVLLQAGDHTAALALREEAAASALRELGPGFPTTQEMSNDLACTRRYLLRNPSGARAAGTLVGLASKPELNGRQVGVVGFDAAKGRYHVRHVGNARGKPIGIKPENLIFREASAVIVEGLDVAPEWNGKRALVESYDAATRRYRLLVKGRTKTLGVKVACCKLEFAVEQEQREQEATRRARVEANVRAALAARELEAGAGATE
jgi:hypothetical protein